ncbi:phosphomethylpyrimidine synthase ThiC [Heliobacterium undosum]|uniref:Phosphomethylpyrimidine synthase n=1 Tax=Heliomicrobium undosum TaxID=121734 RepID=A0A845L2A2_9FIRM|nr:phosphomethylpyrimidine synthase ThiC [Heliomicrobium undosum]MZP30383.1 phosphomethylpyrimidine synthase ThiC [Heliomicrobium undosum]
MQRGRHYGTQMERALRGEITPEMVQVAESEGWQPEALMAEIAAGRIVIPANNRRPRESYCGVGRGLRTKVNANIGTSKGTSGIEFEKRKLDISIECGADAVMDLSTGPDIDGVRRALIDGCPIAFGTVPIYQATVEAQEMKGAIINMTEEDILRGVQKQAEDGVDFMTIHCGLTMEAVERLRKHPRIADIVSRGGSFLTGWMLHHQRQNPFYAQFDRILEIAQEYDITLSLGDALRPGCIADATDRGQVQELMILGELVQRCRAAGVQVIVEGPGHVPMDQVEMNIKLQKRLCEEAPFYVLGPLVTDVAPGYDHITSAIGGAIAAAAGADFLCYVTPAEHLGLPDEQDVRQGVIASRIAGHAADLAKGIKGAMDWDKAMGKARKDLDWGEQRRLAMDPTAFDKHPHTRDKTGCSMCGPYCAMRIVSDYLGRPAGSC